MNFSYRFISRIQFSQINWPCKFMLTQSQNLPSDLRHYLALVFWTPMLQNMLDHIVTILILKVETGRGQWEGGRKNMHDITVTTHKKININKQNNTWNTSTRLSKATLTTYPHNKTTDLKKAHGHWCINTHTLSKQWLILKIGIWQIAQ